MVAVVTFQLVLGRVDRDPAPDRGLPAARLVGLDHFTLLVGFEDHTGPRLPQAEAFHTCVSRLFELRSQFRPAVSGVHTQIAQSQTAQNPMPL